MTTTAEPLTTFNGLGLYAAPSHHVGLNGTTQQFDYPLNEGLFCSSTIHAGEILPQFVGELINKTELEGRINAGRGGYFIQINDQTFLDCYESRSMHMIPAHTELLANYEPFVARDNE